MRFQLATRGSAVTIAIALVPVFCISSHASPQAGEELAIHIVRPGDTLRGLTRSYLGTELRWQENWRLNPDIEDPDLLMPGQRVRVKIQRTESRVPTARILSVAGEVEERPAPIEWSTALSNDLMLERDGIRTHENSSTVLGFPDQTRLAVTEGTLIFLRRTARTLEGVEERSVEIEEGQAEIASTIRHTDPVDIEIVIGNTTASPRAGETGGLQARARKSAAGDAVVMVYEGESEVEAQGQTFELGDGMGMSVPAEGPVAPPEKLLQPPSPAAPEAGSEWQYPNPVFEWRAVDGAASYVVEVCADAECLELVYRETDLQDATWRSHPLPVADLHWRVTAVSASGLDGFPSETSAFKILTDRLDSEPPTVTARVAGRFIASADGSETFYAPSTRVLVQVEDDYSGVKAWRPVINGEEADPEALEGGWGDGPQRVDFLVEDGFGNKGLRKGIEFIVDAEGPEISFEPAGGPLRQRLIDSLDDLEKRWRRRLRRWLAKAEKYPDPSHWALVAWMSDSFPYGALHWGLHTLKWPERRDAQHLTGVGRSPGTVLLAPELLAPDAEGPSENGESGQTLGREFGLVGALDEKAGTRALSLRTVPTTAGEELRIEAVDRLGNRSVRSVPFMSH